MSKNTNSIEKEVDIVMSAKELKTSDYKRYRLPRLLRLARRVTAFSPECDICRDLQVQMARLYTDSLKEQPMIHQNLESHLNMMKNITRHLKDSHGLVEKSYYVKRYILLGLAAGITIILLGLILLCFGITQLALNITITALITRAIVSYTVGSLLDKKARKQGRVL